MAARLDFVSLFLAASALWCQGYRLHVASRTLKAIASDATFVPTYGLWDSVTLQMTGVALVLVCFARILFAKPARGQSVAAFSCVLALLAVITTV